MPKHLIIPDTSRCLYLQQHPVAHAGIYYDYMEAVFLPAVVRSCEVEYKIVYHLKIHNIQGHFYLMNGFYSFQPKMQRHDESTSKVLSLELYSYQIILFFSQI